MSVFFYQFNDRSIYTTVTVRKQTFVESRNSADDMIHNTGMKKFTYAIKVYFVSETAMYTKGPFLYVSPDVVTPAVC